MGAILLLLELLGQPGQVERLSQPAPPTLVNDALLAVGIGLAGADVGLSVAALAEGGRELNPALAPFSGQPGWFGFVSSGATGVGLIACGRLSTTRKVFWCRFAICAAKGAVVAWSAAHSRRGRG